MFIMANTLWMHQTCSAKPRRQDRHELPVHSLGRAVNFTIFRRPCGPRSADSASSLTVSTNCTPSPAAGGGAVRLDRLLWSLEGRLRPEKLAELLPDQARKNFRREPADLDQARRRKAAPRGAASSGRTICSSTAMNTGDANCRPKIWRSRRFDQLIVIMELFEVQFDAPIDPALKSNTNPGDSPGRGPDDRASAKARLHGKPQAPRPT